MEIIDTDPRPAAGRARWCLGLLALIFVTLSILSWRKWTDVQIDFGLQLYTPWQLAQGKVLYRDVSYIAGGPLSQYFHAVLFKIFGASYLVIVLANLIIAGLVAWGLFRSFARVSDWLTALMAGLVTLSVFMFGHLMFVGNFNFITPYTCETVHGFALSLLVIVWLERWLVTNRTKWLAAAGAAMGGVFMTKPELFIAVAGVAGLAAVMREMMLPDGWAVRGRNALVFAGGGLLPIAVFTLYFATVWPTREGLCAAAGAWLPLLGGRAGHGVYYNWCLGLDVPGTNILQMMQYTVALAVIVAVLALGCRFIRQGKAPAAAAIWLVLAAFLFSPLNKLEWMQGGRALPPLALAGAALSAWKWWLVRRGRPVEEFIFPLLWSVFAVLLLLKMGLNARIWHYGFYLGLPAVTLGLLVLFHWLPPFLALFEVDAKWFRASLAVFILVGVVKLFMISNHYYGYKTLAMGKGGDRIMTYPEDIAPAGRCIIEAVKWLRARTPENETLAVMPEGPIINYLARRANPMPYVMDGPHELQVAGAAHVAAVFAAHPPDYVLLMKRASAEFGVGPFGAPDGYGQELMRQVNANYHAEWILGAEPFTGSQFGMKLLKLNRPESK